MLCDERDEALLDRLRELSYTHDPVSAQLKAAMRAALASRYMAGDSATDEPDALS
jgi:hypothetical protein